MSSIRNCNEPRAIARTGVNRRVEKAGAVLGLADDPLRQTVIPVGFVERRRSRLPSRFRRRLHDVNQNGPSPAFAAQVIGQVLDTGRTSASYAARAYEYASRQSNNERVVGVL